MTIRADVLELERTLRDAGITDERVLVALREVPRHALVPEPYRCSAYENQPLPIGLGQTISQPYIVALMSQLGDIHADHKVLEVGTGSGYQTAVLAKLARQVYTVEIVEALAERAREDLQRLRLAPNVRFRVGDGYGGWPEEAPFDAIIVTAAAPDIPEPLQEQLKVGGRLVIPVGEGVQQLRTLIRCPDGFEEEARVAVRFVPMTGEAQRLSQSAPRLTT